MAGASRKVRRGCMSLGSSAAISLDLVSVLQPAFHHVLNEDWNIGIVLWLPKRVRAEGLGPFVEDPCYPII